jgi:hypothetical protein
MVMGESENEEKGFDNDDENNPSYNLTFYYQKKPSG